MSKKAIFIAACFTLLVPLVLSAQLWESDKRLTNSPDSSFTSKNNAWCVAASGDTVHVVWFDERDGNYEIYYKRSTDGGGTNWGSDTRLTNNSSNSYSPSIAVSGSNVHVVWYDKRDGNLEIYYKRSTNGGTSWGSDIRLTNNSDTSYLPSVAVSGSTVHVVWQDTRDGNREIYYKRSTNGGTSWGSDIRLTNNSSYSDFPSVAVSGSNVHVVWYDDRDGNCEIYYKCSTDGGTSWGSDTRLTNNSNYSAYPSVAVSGSTVHVVWGDTRDVNGEIYYKRSTNGGTTWGSDTRLTNYIGSSIYPSVAVRNTNVYVVWEDGRDGYTEIYYKRSTDGGTNWGLDTRLTNSSAYSYYPSVAVSGSTVHVVWCDNRDGNHDYETYYKRGVKMQPDNLVKNSDEPGYVGNDIYNTDGTNQTKAQTVDAGDTAVYHIKIENDGALTDTIVVTGSGSVGDWEVKYYDAINGATDITSQVTGSGWSTGRLNPGEFKEIKLMVIPDEDLPGGSGHDVLVTSTSKRDATKKDAVKASTTTKTIFQPDNQIKNMGEAVYIGDGIYNTDGTNQTKVQDVDAGDTAVYHIKVENDGNTTDTLKVTGTAGNDDWTVKYYDALSGGTDITSQVTGSGWSTGGLAAGGAKEIRVEVIPSSSALGNTSYDVLVTSTSSKNTTKKDAVKAVTTVNPFYQPDNQIKDMSETAYIGDDIYNDDGEDQTKAQTVDAGDTAFYHIKVENDGNDPDTFTITGDGGGMGWDIKYFDALEGGADITSQVTGSGWSSGELDPAGYKEIRIEVVPSSDADTTAYAVLVTSTSKRDNTKKDAVKAVTSVQGDYQPDNQIKNLGEASYIGNDIYNNDGSSQTKSQTVDAGDTVIYHIKIENDGNLTDTIIVTGTPGNAGWTVSYCDALTGGSDITFQVTGSGWSLALASGDAVEIRVEVTSPTSAADGTSFDVLVTSTSAADDARQDAVKAATTVGTGVEEDVLPLVYSLNVSFLSSSKGGVISYTLPEACKIELSIYDATGRLVTNLLAGRESGGEHELKWDGLDNAGNQVGTGVYFIRMSTSDTHLNQRVTLIR